MKVELELMHHPNGVSRVVGTFEYIQMTYDLLRAGNSSKDEEQEIATIGPDRIWRTPDGETWTDVLVTAKSECEV